MKALVITGSRADRNGLEVVHEALLKAGHESDFVPEVGKWDTHDVVYNDWGQTDVAVIGGDRFETLLVAVALSAQRIPIAHIAGGDITEGSADDRYRDAITALADIHFATNEQAFRRLCDINARRGYTRTYPTGSPAIDRIKQTPVLSAEETFSQIGFSPAVGPVALVCVHPNTSGQCAPEYEAWVTRIALSKIGIQAICLGANADNGQEAVNQIWQNALERKWLTGTFIENVSPQVYYSLMTHCDVMVGNSSAMLYEAPCFGLPCVLVGDRQTGRLITKNIWHIGSLQASCVAQTITTALEHGRIDCENPYGDGHSAPRIVKALEESELWRRRPQQRWFSSPLLSGLPS